MARTRSSYIPIGVVTRGLGAIDPIGGASVTSYGLVGAYPEGVEPAFVPGSPAPLLAVDKIDSNGNQRLIDNDIVALHYWDGSADVFSAPDREYTGYSASGYWFEDGRADPTHTPYQAPWSSEVAGVTRGTLSRVPSRVLTVATRKEITLLDADTLDVWMRFTIAMTPSGSGQRLGGTPSTVVSGVKYMSGYLFIATNQGLRIADFRRNGGYLLSSSGNSRISGTSLVLRNSDSFFSGAAPSGSFRDLGDADCLCLDVRIRSESKVAGGSSRSSAVIAIVGHVGGVTAITVGVTSLPRTKKHSSTLSFSKVWEAQDTGDVYSPYFLDANSNWEGLEVRAGDILVTDLPTTHTILEVDQLLPGNRLVLDPPLGVDQTTVPPTPQSGTSYSIKRPVDSVLLQEDLSLYMANGRSAIASNSTQDWFKAVGAGGATPLFGTPSTLEFRGDTSPLSTRVDKVNGLAILGDTLYSATTVGVFASTTEEMEEGRTLALRYTSSASSLTAEYAILEGTDTNAKAIAVDPETGNISVALTDYSSTVTEINPNLEQAFRFFGDVGHVRALESFRNTDGPPDKEVS